MPSGPTCSPFHSPLGGLCPLASQDASRFLQTQHPVVCLKIGALSEVRDCLWQVPRQLGLFQPWHVVRRRGGPGSHLWASPAGAPRSRSRGGCPGRPRGECEGGGERLLLCAWPSPPLLLWQQFPRRPWPSVPSAGQSRKEGRAAVTWLSPHWQGASERPGAEVQVSACPPLLLTG